MREIQWLEDQLRRSYEGPAWHGPSVSEVLRNVTSQMAQTKVIPKAHSIWELVLHIVAWQEAVRRRVSGEPVKLTDEEDWPSSAEKYNGDWDALLKRLEHSYQELLRLVGRLEDSQLNQIVVGENYSIYFILHGLIQHNLFHAGQISILKKHWS